MKTNMLNYFPGLALVMIIAAGCGSGNSGASSDPTNASPGRFPSSSSQTVASALLVLEDSGQIPKLDTSDSLAGTDDDGNGVRDDVDSYIDSLPDSSIQKGALRQISKAYTIALLAGSSEDSTELRNTSVKLMNAVHCLWSIYDASVASDRLGDIRKVNVNTVERFKAFMEFGRRVSGWSVRLPREGTCDYD